MTYERKNNIIHNIQTGMIGFIFLGVGALIKIEFDNSRLLTEIAIKQMNDERDIGTMQGQVGLLQSQEQNLEVRTSLLEQDIKK